MNNQVGIAKINGREISIGGNRVVVSAIKRLSRFGLIMPERMMKE